ncbi:hypothetical protein EUGRSUZ_H00549 [Eucalyptus grandis]|uniref:NADP-dependent oxidoreductase domain-containing protein n=2 Tax=Eucalyptus grandis TaxID=71139 RepID=A0A059AV99_EUCGR|nr:hypothetical protein EUGRSUZ_H00549 [Eucalyptus grandis]
MDVVLSSGHRMPLIRFGTFTIPLPPPDVLTSVFPEAIGEGYRHFDTAAFYGSEVALGQAMAEALDRGLIESRSHIFITTSSGALKLGLEYVDQYLIHWPLRLKEGTEGFNFKGKMLPFDMKGTWETMEACSKLGLAKSIGVSNFGTKKLSQLLMHATIPPTLEMNVGWRQEKLREYCREKGIHVTVLSPLGANGASWGSLAVMESPLLKDIAAAKGKTVAQQGSTFIVKSFNKGRVRGNLQILGWKLIQEDLERLNLQIPQKRGFVGEFSIF